MPALNELRWIDSLEDDDLAFVKRFILVSGSLKELADAYDVSYPTLRLRLDRLIEKIKVLDSLRIEDRYERLLRAQFADGKLDATTFKKLLATYQQEKKGNP
ncbi:MAG TPA: DUF2089 family protein [Verrucomicrobiae bacterium]|nr:DUF2089 family protein [Verrucomicrobiae bacterium]